VVKEENTMADMFIGNNYMVQIKDWQGHWHNPELFIEEKSARAYANKQWKAGAREVVLGKRHREGGYRLLQRATNSENEAKAKHITYMEQLDEDARAMGATIIRG
jgi:hypothetical protein